MKINIGLGCFKSILYTILPLLVVSGSCNYFQEKTRLNYYKLGGFTQGTSYQVIFGSNEFISVNFEIDSILQEMTQSLSVYDSASLISRFNANHPNVVPDKYLTDVVKESIKIMELTDGAFDITAAPLIDFWGFGKTGYGKKDTSKLVKIRRNVGHKKIWLENGKLYKANPEIKINLNAIAQGYTVDILADFLERNNIQNYLVEIGGEIRTRGMNQEGEKWKVGIDRPRQDNPDGIKDIQTIIELGNWSVSTSGNYRKFYIENGNKYTHTINPKTGYPAKNDMLSATIVAKDCATADAIATACMVLGLEKSKSLVQGLKDVEGYFIYSGKRMDDQVFYTPGFEQFIIE
jgi:FAD:protein FMN transferase